MSAKQWEKVSGVISEVLSETLNKSQVDTLMNKFSSRKGELMKSEGKAKGEKKPKDPNAPKRAKSSYMMFCAEQRKEIVKNNPKLSVTEIMSKLGKTWKELKDEQKKKYEALATEDKKRYEREMEDYEPAPEFENAKSEKGRKRGEKKGKDGPKRALSAYMFFCADERERIKQEDSGLSNKEIMSEMGRRWKALSDSDKEPYVRKHEEDKRRYENETGEGVPKGEKVAKAAPKGEKEKKEEKKAVEKVEKKPAAKTAPKGEKEEKKGKVTEKEVKESKETKGKGGKKAAEKVEEKTYTVEKKTPGYELFYQDNEEELLNKNSKWGKKKVVNEINRLWLELPDKDKKQYEKEAEAGDSDSEEELNE